MFLLLQHDDLWREVRNRLKHEDLFIPTDTDILKNQMSFYRHPEKNHFSGGGVHCLSLEGNVPPEMIGAMGHGGR